MQDSIFPKLAVDPNPRSRGALHRATTLRDPPPTRLSLAVLRSQLAASIGEKELARIKPVEGLGAREERRKSALELRAVRAAMLPQRAASRRRIEAKNLLYATIAVCRYDQKCTGQLLLCVNPEEHVVVEFSLLPVIDELEPTKRTPELVKQRPEDEGLCEVIDLHERSLPRFATSATCRGQLEQLTSR